MEMRAVKKSLGSEPSKMQGKLERFKAGISYDQASVKGIKRRRPAGTC